MTRFEDTKGVIKSRKSKRDRQHNDQRFEDTKGVIRSHKSQDRQYNGQQKKDKRTNNETLQREQKIEQYKPQ